MQNAISDNALQAARLAAQRVKRRFITTSDKSLYLPGGPISAVVEQVRASLPIPHPKQRDIIESRAKRKVVCTGRRSGKTVTGVILGVDALLEGKKVLLASASQDQADIFWTYLRRYLRPLFDIKAIYKNETKRLIEMGEGAIKVKTGRDADVLRGFNADLLILDECALLDADAWYEVGAPMLADNDGTAIFNSTPNRKNWFYRLYQQAIQDTSGRWAAWHGTTHDNPYLSQEAVQALVADMTEESYRQEIMAEFLEGAGQVFRNIETCATEVKREPYAGSFGMGIDTAQQQDYTVLCVMDRTTHKQVDLDRFHRVSWEVYRGRIKAMAERWKPDVIEMEINSVGAPNFEALQNDGLPVRAFETTAVSKPPLIESLVLAFERQELGIINEPVQLSELGAFERKVSPATGRSQYSAPEGLHDDTVIALALAWRTCAHVTAMPRVLDW